MSFFNPTETDGFYFKIHCKVTFILLIIFSLILHLERLFNGAIECTGRDLPGKFVDTYCWTHSTYIMESSLDKTRDHEVPIPGVSRSSSDFNDVKHEQIYYPWVAYFLMIQSFFFLNPKLLWKKLERGKIRALTRDLKSGKRDAETSKKTEQLINYLNANFGKHNIWALSYLFCEILCLLNVFIQIFIVNKFLSGKFLSYGSLVASYDPDDDRLIDPNGLVFPLMSRCDYFRLGPSGSMLKYGLICQLKLNVLNRKIFMFLWVWFILLTVFMFLTIVFRLISTLIPIFSAYLVFFQTHFSVPVRSISGVMTRCSIGDRFLFYMLSKNVDGVIFGEVINGLGYKEHGFVMHQNDETNFGVA